MTIDQYESIIDALHEAADRLCRCGQTGAQPKYHSVGCDALVLYETLKVVVAAAPKRYPEQDAV